MIFFQQFFLDREKDIAVDLYLEGNGCFMSSGRPTTIPAT